MTHLFDIRLCTALLAVIVSLGLHVSAAASEAGAAPAIEPQVTLTNRVEKIQRVANPDGSVEARLVPAEQVIPGDELRYTIVFENQGGAAVDAGSVVITNALPVDTEYLDGTAFGAGTEISFSTDGGNSFAQPQDLFVLADGDEVLALAKDYTAIRWVFAPELAPGEKSYVSFNVRLK
jgi:uncharacterized repeat protein (TIGR01451 family)